jgi:hypothetical protein
VGALAAKFNIANAYAGRSQFTQQIGCSLGFRGVVTHSWMVLFPSAFVWRRNSLQRETSFMLCTTWTGRDIVHAMHYLDDSLIIGHPNSSECSRALQESLRLCDRLGFPIAPHKLEGPAFQLAFLGIHIDSESDTLSLPADKYAHLRATIAAAGSRSCSREGSASTRMSRGVCREDFLTGNN